jgi:glutamine amidotransferase
VIALIDYGAGNLTSVKKALAATGAEVLVPRSPDALAPASAIIVPGVGHFSATRALDRSWTDAILALVAQGRPLLGICLGMQWLYAGSEEAPDCPGLGVLEGRCYRLCGSGPHITTAVREVHSARRSDTAPANAIKIPHVGWNALTVTRSASIIDNVPTRAQVYFTHSYVAPVTGDTVAVTEHGEPFAAVVQRGRIAGVQFHPEKSGDIGLQILRNFLAMAMEPASAPSNAGRPVPDVAG